MAGPFDDLIKTRHPELVSRLRRQGLPREVAEEVALKTWATLVQSPPSAPSLPLWPWVCVTAQNHARDARKAFARRRKLEDALAQEAAEAPSGGASDPARIAEAREALAIVQHAMNAMDDDARDAFQLVVLDELPVTVVAVYLRKTPYKVDMLVSRARAAISSAMKHRKVKGHE